MQAHILTIINRLKSIGFAFEGFEPDIIRFINVRSFEQCVSNDIRCKILSYIAKNVNTAQELASALGIARTAIYRHLNMLEKSGFLVHKDNKYFIAARLFLVYDVEIDNNGRLLINVYPDRGAFVDKLIGFVVVKGPQCKCEVCNYRELCLKAVKELAQRVDAKIRSESPVAAFKDIVTTLVQRDVGALIKRGYLIMNVPYEEAYT